jgi:hypothetical protein
MAANKDIIVASNAVIKPNFSGNLNLINGIKSTLAITIPIPVKAVPSKSNSIPPKTRRITPIARIIIPRKTALPIPSFFPIAGAKREKVAKVNKGSVVRNPANPFESPKSSRIKGIRGPTDEMEVRRLIETRRIPAIRNPLLVVGLFNVGD